MGEPFRAPADQPYPSRQWFDQADANHDGKITREEFIADALRFFDTLDTDHAGDLGEDDIARYESEIVPELGRLKLKGGGDEAAPSLPVGGGHRRNSIETPEDQAQNGMSMLKHSDEPQGQINTATRREDTPEGAAIFSVLPFPEPVTSARAYYGQRITRKVFADAASRRFDMLTGKATVLRFEDLPLTPVQPRSGPPRRAN
jgi:hypothetical protein